MLGDGSAYAIVDGYKRGVGALVHETVQGVADLVRQPYLGKTAKKMKNSKDLQKVLLQESLMLSLVPLEVLLNLLIV